MGFTFQVLLSLEIKWLGLFSSNSASSIKGLKFGLF